MKVKHTVNTVFTHKLLSKIYHRGASSINWSAPTVDGNDDEVEVFFRLKPYNPADADDYPGMIVFDTDSKVIRLNGDPYPDIESLNIYYENSLPEHKNLFKNIPTFNLILKLPVLNLFRMLEYTCTSEELKETFGLSELNNGTNGWEINGIPITQDLTYDIPTIIAGNIATFEATNLTADSDPTIVGLGYVESYNEMATAKAISGVLDVEYPRSFYKVRINYDTDENYWVITTNIGTKLAHIQTLEEIGLVWLRQDIDISNVEIVIRMQEVSTTGLFTFSCNDAQFNLTPDIEVCKQKMQDAGVYFMSSNTYLLYNFSENLWHLYLCEEDINYSNVTDIYHDFGITLTDFSDISNYTFKVSNTKIPTIDSDGGNGNKFLADDMTWKQIPTEWIGTQVEYDALVQAGLDGNYQNIYIIEP